MSTPEQKPGIVMTATYLAHKLVEREWASKADPKGPKVKVRELQVSFFDLLGKTPYTLRRLVGEDYKIQPDLAPMTNVHVTLRVIQGKFDQTLSLDSFNAVKV